MAPSLLLPLGFISQHRFIRLALLGLLADRGHSCMLTDLMNLNEEGLKILQERERLLWRWQCFSAHVTCRGCSAAQEALHLQFLQGAPFSFQAIAPLGDKTLHPESHI